MCHRLQDLIDINRLQAFIDSFSGVSGIPTAILCRDGSLLASSGWSDVCVSFYRANEKSLQSCMDSNATVISRLQQEGNGIIRYTCPHGFMKAAYALMVDGEQLGTLLTGQILLQPPDEGEFRSCARSLGFEEEEYMAALRNVPVITSQQMDKNLDCLQKLTDLIVEMAGTAHRERLNADSKTLLARRYDNILQTTTDGFWIMDGEGRCLDANDISADRLGYSRDELCGMYLRDIDAGERPEEMAAHVDDIKRTGFDRFEALHRRKDGTVMEVEVSTSYIAEENIFIAFIRDITVKKRAEESLRQSEERFRNLFEKAPVPYQSIDADTRIVEVNDAWCRMMGYERPADVVGTWMSDYLTENGLPQLKERMEMLKQTGSMSGLSCQLVRRDGTLVDVLVEGSVSCEGEGGLCQTHCILIDVTEKKKAEEQIRRMNEELEQRVHERTAELEESNKELESFCYSISHDLRAPLRAIDGCTRILREEYELLLDAMGKDLCARISSNSLRMGSLIDDLLTFSRAGRSSLEPEELDMDFIARFTFDELVPVEKRGGIEFTVGNLPPAKADRTTMGQVWLNLLDNALKYSSREPHPAIEVSGKREGDMLVYTVRDNGVGFDMAYQDKLFGVFLRAHAPSEFPGTGVGLSIVERIVQRHGGRVWAEGEVGKGASFHFSLPA